MRQARRISQRMVSTARCLHAAARRGSGVGVLAGLLLLLLGVGAVGLACALRLWGGAAPPGRGGRGVRGPRPQL